MISDVVSALQTKFEFVNNTPQEKLSIGDVVVVLGKPSISIETLETYQLDWNYTITSLFKDPEEAQVFIVDVIKCLEENFAVGRFKVIDCDVIQDGAFYIINVTFMVTEEVFVK
jgi:DNA integrity scanning protein DisA with diadenylate cyclase activity